MVDVFTTAADRTTTLNRFTLDDLAPFTREKSFPVGDSPDFRVLYAGRDDIHGALKYVLSRCSRSLRFNMYGYADNELDALVQQLVSSPHVYVQGTLDRSQAGGTHEKQILQTWSPAVRSSITIGQSATHDISHTKGGVVDGIVAWEGSTNWSDAGEGTHVADKRYHAQNNTCAFYTHRVQVARFMDELDCEHTIALHQQQARS